jgi:hypothetical protein
VIKAQAQVVDLGTDKRDEEKKSQQGYVIKFATIPGDEYLFSPQ